MLERIVHFSRSIQQLNGRFEGFCEDTKQGEPSPESIDMALSAVKMQSRIIDSMDTALECILNQTMTLVCNIVLARRDTMLKDCKKLSCEDQLKLRNSSFVDSDLFPTEAINVAENNLLKRASTQRSSQPDKKRKFNDFSSNSAFRPSPSFRGLGKTNYSQRGSRSSTRGQPSYRK